jgi:protein-L-isoaspartate(D-aspartate) O-methyltransferase
MIDLASYRRFFAEEIEALVGLQTPGLVDALASVPRERFLPPGPWTVFADTEYMPGAPRRPRITPDADPRRLYHNLAVAIDPERRLFNGHPATLAAWIDALALEPGARVLHIGGGLGYYTAVLGAAVGSGGAVTAFEIDESLAADARANLAFMPWVSVRQGDGTAVDAGPFDAVLVNAGVTHPLDAWLDLLSPGGCMVLPITATMAAMGPTVGKGLVWRLMKQGSSSFGARVLAMTTIYSAVGVRDDALNTRIGQAMMAGPARWRSVTRLRRDAHEPSASCWLHCRNCCWSIR